jgi:hypothetical protein
LYLQKNIRIMITVNSITRATISQSLTTGVNFTTAAGAIPYVPGNAINNSTGPTYFTFFNAARVGGGSGYITRVSLATDQLSFAARTRLYLYNDDPAAFIDTPDNTPFYPMAGYPTIAYVGYVDIPAPSLATPAGRLNALTVTEVKNVGLAFKCLPSATYLYCQLVALDAFTPTSSQYFRMDISVEQY